MKKNLDGKYENTNIWKHSEKVWKVQGHISFELPVPLAEWEVQLVWDEGKKMAIAGICQKSKVIEVRKNTSPLRNRLSSNEWLTCTWLFGILYLT